MMLTSNFWNYIFITVIMLHLVVGFGYLMYKLSPKKEDKKKEINHEE